MVSFLNLLDFRQWGKSVLVWSCRIRKTDIEVVATDLKAQLGVILCIKSQWFSKMVFLVLKTISRVVGSRGITSIHVLNANAT